MWMSRSSSTPCPPNDVQRQQHVAEEQRQAIARQQHVSEHLQRELAELRSLVGQMRGGVAQR
jgi:hypothetical protein